MASFKGLSRQAVANARFAARHEGSTMMHAGTPMVMRGGVWTLDTKHPAGQSIWHRPPAPRGSIHSAWSRGPRLTSRQKAKIPKGSGSRSEAARKAWVTRRGH